MILYGECVYPPKSDLITTESYEQEVLLNWRGSELSIGGHSERKALMFSES